jgi:hypothetical protein
MKFLSAGRTDEYREVDGYAVYNTKSEQVDMFGHYDYYAYSLFKSHWTNGVKMFREHGQGHCCNDSGVVIASTGYNDLDHNILLRELKESPDNTIVFAHGGRWTHDLHGMFDQVPAVMPNYFAGKYSTFMQFVSVWKWIDFHKNQPELLNNDTLQLLIARHCFTRNIQFKIVTEVDHQHGI